MVGNEKNELYSCKCINVQVKSSPPPTTGAQSGLPPASDWTTVFVPQDEDIKIIYPHLTLRSRHRAPYIPDPTRCARYTTLTCLSCRTLVYRIHQTVLLDDEVNIREGPIITKGWAETEVLRSSSGWLEVSTKDVLIGEAAINKQKSLPEFSKLFGIVLPAASIYPSPSFPADFESISQSITQYQSIPRYQLPPIPPVFPEPKSTRSLFTVLAAIATRHSHDLRSEAEEYIDRIVKEKVEEIKRAEAQLKRHVLALLAAYSDGIKKAEQEQSTLQGGSSQTEPAKESTSSPPVSPSTPVFSGVPSSVIRDFIPMRITPSPVTPATPAKPTSGPSRNPSSPPSTNSLPRVSALSASLATSSFHHPKARADGPSPTSTSPPDPSRATVSDADSFQSLQSASSATLIQQRRISEDMDTLASYRFLQLEEEMKKRETEAENQRKNKARGRASVQGSAGPSNVSRASASSPRANGVIPKAGKGKEVETKAEEPSSASPKSKGRRKVTFDVKVDNPSAPAPESVTSVDPISEDMLFDYEEETNARDVTVPVVLPLVESASQYPSTSGRPRIHKRSSSGGLPASFSALKPASSSSPVASHIPLPIPTRISPASDSSHVATHTPSSRSATATSDDSRTRATAGSDPAFDTTTATSGSINSASAAQALMQDRRTRIHEMLAASLPSHRAAWAGKNYETFLSDAYADADDDADEDEEHDDDDEVEPQAVQGIPSSVPVTIHRPSSKAKTQPLTLASYQPNAVLSDNMDLSNDSSRADEKRQTSTALRRVSYAEGDVNRGVDPGMFDYVLEVHPEEEEEDDDYQDDSGDRGEDGESNLGGRNKGTNGTSTTTSKGRARAQKILEAQAKSGVPDDGMWRSLI
ncbi:hypothetical protein FB446DRAFT_843033 [Lentinula raphanica]|nr:hypothetical protein FB446DRAFT_843033 [Lentinula raphanica]